MSAYHNWAVITTKTHPQQRSTTRDQQGKKQGSPEQYGQRWCTFQSVANGCKALQSSSSKDGYCNLVLCIFINRFTSNSTNFTNFGCLVTSADIISHWVTTIRQKLPRSPVGKYWECPNLNPLLSLIGHTVRFITKVWGPLPKPNPFSNPNIWRTVPKPNVSHL